MSWTVRYPDGITELLAVGIPFPLEFGAQREYTEYTKRNDQLSIISEPGDDNCQEFT